VTLAEVCPSIRDNANTFTPELIAIEAQEWRRSQGVIFCTFARFTAPANHPPSDFGRGRYAPSPNTRSAVRLPGSHLGWTCRTRDATLCRPPTDPTCSALDAAARVR
jgi:hypothetical protein